MKTIHQYYSNIPCQGQDCIFWGGEYEEVNDYDAGYDFLDKWHECFRSVWHGEHCNKSEELKLLRQKIYNNADNVATECYTSGKYKKPWIQAGKVFDELKKEWTEMKCPFYEVENEYKL